MSIDELPKGGWHGDKKYHTTPRRQQAEERSEVVSVRLTPTERAGLDRLRAAYSLTRSSMLRLVLLLKLKLKLKPKKPQ